MQTAVSRRLNRAGRRLLGVIALAGLVFGAGVPQGEAAAAPPATNYYQIGLTAAVGSTIGTADDSASGGTSCTLRDAAGIASAGTTSGTVNGCVITQVGAGGPYVIRLPKGTYTYTLASGEIGITATDVYIEGSKTTNSIIQGSTCDPITLPNGCAPATSRLFQIATTASNKVVMENLTLRYGRCAGACTVSNSDGGAFYLAGGGTVTLNGVAATHNTADGGSGSGTGGAVYINNGTLVVANKSVFTGNVAGDTGGAIYGGFNASIVVDGSTLQDNHAGYGGAIRLDNATASVKVIRGSKVLRTAGSATPSADFDGGGIYIWAGTVLVDGSTFSNLNAGGNGGAIFETATNSKLTIQNKATLSSNSAQTGGALLVEGGAAILDGSTLKTNTAVTYGGGVYLVASTATFTAQHGAAITGNSAGNRGGGLYNEAGTITITGKSQISKNKAAPLGEGGGIYDNGGSITTINGGSLITGNMAPGGNGGGLSGSGFTIDGATISLNSAQNGGGVFGQFDARNALFTGNTAIDSGGAMVVNGSSTLTGSTVSKNSATGPFAGGGGALANATLVVNTSTFSANKAAQGNGGAFNQQNGAISYFNNSTFSGNSAMQGGALWVTHDSTIQSFSVTITKNSASQDTGGVFVDVGGTTTTYTGSIISGNTAPVNPDCTANVVSQDYNLVGSSCDATQPHDLTGAAGLSALANNGGPTMTVALIPGGPAIDAGNPAGCQGNTGSGLVALSTDQRGYLRTWGAHCDIGAFEAQPKPAALSAPKAGAAVSKASFSWKPATGAASQVLAVDTSSTCGTGALNQPLGATAKSFSAAGLAYGSYFWCLQTTMPGAIRAADSEVRAFEYTFAKTPLPNAYARQGSVKFSWLKLTDPANAQPATGYDLAVSTSSTCASADVANLTGLVAVTAAVPLTPGNYTWAVTVHFPSSADAVSTCRSLTITY